MAGRGPLPLLCAMFAVAAMAGCSQPAPADGPSDGAAPVAPTPVAWPYEGRAFVQSAGTCGPVPVACLGFAIQSFVLFAVPSDSEAVAVRFEAAPVPNFSDPVRWRLTCISEDDSCRSKLADGEGPLPVSAEVGGIRLSPGAQVLLSLEAPGAAVPGGSLALTMSRQQASQVTGSADLVPAAFPIVLDQVAVAAEGHSGPCDFVEPTCTHYPGGSWQDVVEDGLVREANVTMTWTSSSSLDAQLGLRIGPVACGDPCSAPLQVVGPSPLTLDVRGLHYDGLRVEAFHARTTDALPYDALYGTRTPVSWEGVARLQPPEPEA